MYIVQGVHQNYTPILPNRNVHCPRCALKLHSHIITKQKCTLSKVCTKTTLPYYYQTEMYIVQGVHQNYTPILPNRNVHCPRCAPKLHSHTVAYLQQGLAGHRPCQKYLGPMSSRAQVLRSYL